MTEEEWRRLADRAEIAGLLARYARCIDKGDWDGLQETYAPDGVMVHGSVSAVRDRVPELARRIVAGVDRAHHVVSDPFITVRGDAAESFSHYFATHIAEDGTIVRQAGGWYECVLARTDRGWRFTRVTAVPGWRTGQPLVLG